MIFSGTTYRRKSMVLGWQGLAVAALTLGGGGVSASAQTGEPLRAEQGSAWWLDKLGNECSALRVFGPTGSTVYLTLSRAGRDQPISVMLSGTTVPVVGVGQNVVVRLTPRNDGETLVTGQGSAHGGANRAIVLNGMSMAFLERFAATQVMQLELPNGHVALRLEDMARVIEHLRDCDGSNRAGATRNAPAPQPGHTRDRSRPSNAGRGTARSNPPAQPQPGATQQAGAQDPRPRNNEAEWIRAEDLQDFRFDGSVVVDLLVDTSGRPTGCTIAQPSGNAALDARMCRLLQSRARFYAATDASGTPIQAYFRKRIRFAAGR